MASLIAPDSRFHASFLDSHAEWAGAQQDGAGLDRDDDVASAEGFAAWVESLNAAETEPRQPGHVTCTYRWIVEGDEYLGAISFRHELTDFLLNWGGHIGYGVRPSARRRGLASWALGETLILARGRGYERVLLTCDDGNVGSARTIERAGGELEDVRGSDEGTRFRRYWIPIG
jgi:predicted acetyltransferase